MSTPIVIAEHVSKWYGQVSGLNDVTVSIPPGITGLLGPNGAGKSTFMKLMTGQLKPSQGTIRVLGTSLWDTPAAFSRIAAMMALMSCTAPRSLVGFRMTNRVMAEASFGCSM